MANMKNLIIILLVVLGISCASKKSNTAIGNTRNEPVLSLDDNSYLITIPANDPTYAFTKQNPVKVGGMSPLNQRRYLNGLLGPNAEPLSYFRVGSCCAFKTPNSIFGDSGMLDIYSVFWEGATDTLTIYINLYDEGNLRIPDGLTAKTPKFN